MPTHRELPDAYLRAPMGGRRRRWPRWALITVAFLAIVAATYLGASRLLPDRQRASGTAKLNLAAAPPVAHRRIRGHDRLRARQRRGHERPAQSPALRSSTSDGYASAMLERTVDRTVPPAASTGGLTFAVGASLPGQGRPPGLVASATHDWVTVRSRSPVPVTISVNRYGRPFRRWTTLKPRGTALRMILTGRPYGYCFAQPAGDGYAPTRGCGTLIMHSYVNGVRLPDGSAVSESFSFVAG